VYIAAAFLSFPALLSINGAANSQATPKEISLQSCDATGGAPIFNSSTQSDGWVDPKMAFDHEGNLWAGFVIKTPSLIDRSKPSGEFQYLIAKINESSHCTVQFKMFSTEASAHGVMINAKGKTIVVSNNEVHLFDSGAKEEAATAQLRGRSRTDGYYHVYQPFDRNEIVVVSRQGPSDKDKIEWLDSDNLVLKASCTVPYSHDFPDGLFSFSSQGIWIGEEDNVETTAGAHTPLIDEIAYCRKIRRIYQGLASPHSATLLGEFIVLTYSDGQVSVRTVEGKSIPLHPLTEHVEPAPWTRPVMSEDGSRVGIAMERVAGGSEALDISPHTVSRWIEVYETTAWKMISKIEVSPKTWDVNFCFSPNGKAVAVEARGIVRIYRPL
jgi:hypothetical protein